MGRVLLGIPASEHSLGRLGREDGRQPRLRRKERNREETRIMCEMKIQYVGVRRFLATGAPSGPSLALARILPVYIPVTVRAF